MLTKLLSLVALAVPVAPVSSADPAPNSHLTHFESRASAKSIPRSQIVAISAQIDSLALAQLQKNAENPNKPTTDEIFLRRIYLDAIGRIPTLEETTELLTSRKENKRAELIDELLDSYGMDTTTVF